MNPNDNVIRLPSTETRVCHQCGVQSARIESRIQNFCYGDGDKAVELQAEVRVWACTSCEHSYLDDSAEDARHEAICRYLNILTPREIKALRDRYGLSQADFANITGLGIASIKRWETGVTTQNVSSDRLLRLLQDPANLRKLRDVANLDNEGTHVDRRFRTPITAEIRAAQKSFGLRCVY